MPSASLQGWQNDRLLRLAEIDAQCAASIARVQPQSNLVDENLRGYVLLLSAHFQGFCRDLYTECALIVVSKVRPALRLLVQAQFTSQRKLDFGNPNLKNLREDFERFDFTLDFVADDSANAARLTHLGELNRWRNVAAHHGTIPAHAATLSLPLLQNWRDSCNGLAISLDRIMYNRIAPDFATIPMVTSSEVWIMPAKRTPRTLKVGDIVTISHSGRGRGKIVELRGPLAPGGKQVYRVIVRRKPSPVYIELSEDQVALAPAKA